MDLGKDLVAASATPLVLAILTDGDSYGYAIIKRVTELSDGQLQWTDGMLYPVPNIARTSATIDSMFAPTETQKRRRFDALVCWRLDRLGRSLKHLVTLLDELQALGVAFVSLGEGIDCTTPAGRLQLHVLAALAEFERARIAERVRAGLARARANGQRLGQKPLRISSEDLDRTAHLSVRRAAAALGIPRSVLHRARLSREPVGIGGKKGA